MLVPRGPDVNGLMGYERNGAHVYIGHTRLCINTPDSGAQPLTYEKDNAFLTINGEIYNSKELEHKYFPSLDCFRSDCDVVGHMLKNILTRTNKNVDTQVGNALNELDGIFSLGICKDDLIVVARDPIGVTSLYLGWTLVENRLVSVGIASEMKALLPLCEHIIEFDPGTYCILDIQTLFTRHTEDPWGMQRYFLPRWWDVSPATGVPFVKEHFAATFGTAVKKRLMSDVRVGALLSGGLDSSLVAALAARELPNITTFSIGMVHNGVPVSSDLHYARKVATHINSTHHEVHFTAEEGISVLRDVIRAVETYDPTSVRASTPMWLLARYIRRRTNVRVCLSGEGADEAWAGYLYFWKAPSDEIVFNETRRLVKNLHMFDCKRAHKSMIAHGIEARVPFLDKGVLDLALTTRGSDRHPRTHGIEKHCVRSSFRGDLLPDEILLRQKEQFGDGVGYGWIDSLKAHADAVVSDAEFENRADRFGNIPILTKEEYLYLDIYCDIFGRKHINYNESHTWRPKWCDSLDPSGRTVSDVHKEWAR